MQHFVELSDQRFHCVSDNSVRSVHRTGMRFDDEILNFVGVAREQQE